MYVAGSFLEKKSEAGQECEKIIIKIPSAIEKRGSKLNCSKDSTFLKVLVFFKFRAFFTREVGFGCKQNLELGNCCFVVQLS